MALSGIKTVAVAGTAEAMGTQRVGAPLMIKALTTNTGLMYIGNDGAGDVSSANGLPLLPGEAVVFEFVIDLSKIMQDSAVSGEGSSWLILVA